MSPEGTVEATRIWKRFRSDRRQSYFAAELAQLRARLRGAPAPDRWRWALRDVEVQAEPGESIGLIGANGSGKSTLLKILCRVMYPDAGRLTVSGRVGALIEVSSGIHPQLSGRENIYLYGSLLGLQRREVASSFDDIVEFAEVGQAIDRMVKYYSSGMKMRLGFAVAAFLNPHILLVDEVLAVGDAAFQQKCLNRMSEVLSQGTTLIFVSHDLASVEATCSRGIWLHQGVVHTDGGITDTLNAYRQAIEEAAEILPVRSGPVGLTKVEISGEGGAMPRTHGQVDVRFIFESDSERGVKLDFGFTEGTPIPIFSLRRDLQLSNGETEIRCRLTDIPLPKGRYFLWINVTRGSYDLVPWHPVARFDVAGPALDPSPRGIVRMAPVHVQAEWEVEG
ncbi:MAG: ABC transporter ATP-binding protein [Actinobacteria bacterium]|nr:ABC transporter ATP-binding protein [Actinomycetota bacterium]